MNSVRLILTRAPCRMPRASLRDSQGEAAAIWRESPIPSHRSDPAKEADPSVGSSPRAAGASRRTSGMSSPSVSSRAARSRTAPTGAGNVEQSRAAASRSRPALQAAPSADRTRSTAGSGVARSTRESVLSVRPTTRRPLPASRRRPARTEVIFRSSGSGLEEGGSRSVTRWAAVARALRLALSSWKAVPPRAPGAASASRRISEASILTESADAGAWAWRIRRSSAAVATSASLHTDTSKKSARCSSGMPAPAADLISSPGSGKSPRFPQPSRGSSTATRWMPPIATGPKETSRHARRRRWKGLRCSETGIFRMSGGGTGASPEMRRLNFSTRRKATGTSSTGSSVSETRIVSPIPSSSRAPMPMADLIRPSSPSPASVTPRWNG